MISPYTCQFLHHLSKKQHEPFIKELIGHSHGSITMDVYGGSKPLSVLLNDYDYHQFSISHIPSNLICSGRIWQNRRFYRFILFYCSS